MSGQSDLMSTKPTARALRVVGFGLLLGFTVLGAVTAYKADRLRNDRLALLAAQELHENEILKGRRAALLGRAFELARKIDASAARLETGMARPARMGARMSATSQLCSDVLAAPANRDGEAALSDLPSEIRLQCAGGGETLRPRPAAQLRAAL